MAPTQYCCVRQCSTQASSHGMLFFEYMFMVIYVLCRGYFDEQFIYKKVIKTIV